MTVLAIAKSTFKETIRQRVLLILLVFGIVVISSSFLFSYMRAGEEQKFVADLGLGAMLFFGLLMAVVLGAFMIPTDIERRIVFTILSKPVRRIDFILGKFLGGIATILLNVLLMGLAFVIVYYFKNNHQLDLTTVKSVLMIFCELALVLSIAVTVSTVSTPWFTVIFTMFVYFLGAMNEALAYIARHAEQQVVKLGMWLLSALIPHIENFDLRQKLLLDEPVPWLYLVKVGGYSLIYIVVMMAIAYLLFNEREF